jgi:hypothetical protein
MSRLNCSSSMYLCWRPFAWTSRYRRCAIWIPKHGWWIFGRKVQGQNMERMETRINKIDEIKLPLPPWLMIYEWVSHCFLDIFQLYHGKNKLIFKGARLITMPRSVEFEVSCPCSRFFCFLHIYCRFRYCGLYIIIIKFIKKHFFVLHFVFCNVINLHSAD